MNNVINHSHVKAVLDALCFEARDFDNYEEMLEAREWAAYRANLIFEHLPDDASRATFIATLRRMFPALGPRLAERIVGDVVREHARRPIPQFVPDANGFIHPGCELAVSDEDIRLRRLAISLYLEKRASRPARIPKHEPEVLRAETILTAPTNEELDGWMERLHELEGSHEASAALRRLKLGMVRPGDQRGILRTLDYQPGQQHTPPAWLVKGLFPNRGLGLLVGESQAGKSFLAVHAAVCVARGLPFFGKKTKPGGVLYIAAEGGSGVLPRIHAADDAIGGTLPAGHMLRPSGARAAAPIKVVVETPNLSRDGDTAALSRTIRAAAIAFEQEGHTLSLVVVDTWHAALAGADEQAAGDAGHALKPLKEAVEEMGVFTLIVHHPGKDLERGARGSSALRAAVDTEIELRVPGFDGAKAKPAAVARRGQLIKQRDGAVGEEFHYRLNIVELGRDEDGDPWTTCTVLPCSAPELDAAGKPVRRGDARLMKAMEAAVTEAGQERVELRVVRGFFNNAGPAGEKEEARRKAFRRALDKACDGGLIETDTVEQFVRFSNSARDTGQWDTP
jgi:hypothetical protein